MAGIPHFPGRTIAIASGAIIFLAAVLAGLLFVPTKTISGYVMDAASGAPLVDAVVKVGEREFPVGADGIFQIPNLRFGTSIVAEARGYLPASQTVVLDNQFRLALRTRIVEGTATDAVTGQPVMGAAVSAGSLAARSDQQGKFRLVMIDPGAEIVVRAEGFAGQTIKYDGQPTLELSLTPNVVTVQVTNQASGQPVDGAEVRAGHGSAVTNQQGEAQLQYVPEGAEIQILKQGFSTGALAFAGQERLETRLRPDTVTGTVRDVKGQPVAKAQVSDGRSSVYTDEAGAYTITGVPENAKLTVSAAGFERRQLELGQSTTGDVELKPFSAKGLYLTYYGVGNDELRGHVLDLADRTEINAVVIDVKGDRGWIVYRSSVPLVAEIGAQQEIMIPDPRQFLADLRARGVYTIARIVTFKDHPLATSRPDLAVMNADTGRPWVDNEGLSWTDANHEEVWDYNIALAVEAIDLGFDEVQFDYVRFPTDASAGNSLNSVALSMDNTQENRVAAITGFLGKAAKAIHEKGGLISADIFGYVVWRTDDMGIGQKLEEVAAQVDYVSPMVYPNLFWHGLPMEGGEKYANQQSGLFPYEIVYESMKIAAQRIGAAKLRPWLEYYDDYLTGKSYTAGDMEVQKQATHENGITGWLFWDPSNRFGKGGFAEGS